LLSVWRFDSDVAAVPRVPGGDAVSLDKQFHKIKDV
jgi:hypothetical protein